MNKFENDSMRYCTDKGFCSAVNGPFRTGTLMSQMIKTESLASGALKEGKIPEAHPQGPISSIVYVSNQEHQAAYRRLLEQKLLQLREYPDKKTHATWSYDGYSAFMQLFPPERVNKPRPTFQCRLPNYPQKD